MLVNQKSILFSAVKKLIFFWHLAFHIECRNKIATKCSEMSIFFPFLVPYSMSLVTDSVVSFGQYLLRNFSNMFLVVGHSKINV